MVRCLGWQLSKLRQHLRISGLLLKDYGRLETQMPVGSYGQ